MSLAPSHDQAFPAVSAAPAAQSEFRSALAERAVAIGFPATVSAAMMGWLYLLAVAMWNGANWLLS